MTVNPDKEFQAYKDHVVQGIAAQLGQSHTEDFECVAACILKAVKPDAPQDKIADHRTAADWSSFVVDGCSAKLLLREFRGLARTTFQRNKVWRERLSLIAQ